MPEEQAAPAVRASRIERKPPLRPQTMILCLLAFGLVVSLAANIRQEQKTQGLSEDLTALRLRSDRALADLREAQSGLLEQNVRRLDQMETQLRNATADEQQKAASSVSRMRSELKKVVEQRHEEMVTAISDVKADLQAEASARARQAEEIEHDRQAQPAGALDFLSPANRDHSSAASTVLASETKPADDSPPPRVEKKKGFWNKLNPFSRAKKHDSASDAEQ